MTDPVILAAAAYLLMPQLAPTMIHTYPAFDAEQAQAAYASLDHRLSYTGVISPRPHCVGFWCYVFKASYRLAEATDMESANPHSLAATQPAAPAPDLRRHHHHRRHHHGHHRRGR